MKVLFSPCHYIYGKDKEGSESSWAYNIADRIASQYTNSVVITGSSQTSEKKKYKIVEVQKDKRKLDLSLLSALKFNLLYSIATSSELKKNKYNILHHILPFGIDKTFNLSLLLKKDNKMSTVLGPVQSPLSLPDDDIDLSDIRNPNPVKSVINISNYLQMVLSPLVSYLSRKTIENSDVVIVINSHTKKILLSRGIKEDKIIVIPPGIDTDLYTYTPLEKKDKKIIELITVGYLMKRKGIDQIILAVNEVIKKNKSVRLRIVGDGPQKKKLESLVKKLGISKFVIFEGYTPNKEMPKFYMQSHIFVSMSYSESWGQMYLEAMASGLPVISTKNIGSLAIIKDNVFGYLIDQADYYDLSRKIVRLCEDSGKLETFSKSARKEAELKYDWKKVIIPKYVNLYKQLTK